MLDIPINTNHFFKFVTTISFVGSVYFFSFHDLFLSPYIKELTEINIEVAELSAKSGYLRGQYLDLKTKYSKLSKNGYFEYFNYNKSDSIENSKIRFPYYSIVGLKKEERNKIDSLNTASREFAIVEFKLNSISQRQKSRDFNIDLKMYISYVAGFLCFAIFCIALRKWHNSKTVIDK